MGTRTKTKIAKMPALQAALDRESYEWLAMNAPAILDALETEIAQGRSPEQVYLWVLGEYGRDELAQRLRQAARNMQSNG